MEPRGEKREHRRDGLTLPAGTRTPAAGLQPPTRILVFHPQAARYGALLRAHLSAEVEATADESEFRRRLPEADVLVAFRFPVDALREARRLRWVQITSAGTEFLDPTSELARCIVTNGRGIHAAPIADYVLTAAVMLQSDFPGLLRAQAERTWRRRPVATLSGRTLGIAGLGAIGQEIARRAKACGMRTVGLRRTAVPTRDVDVVFGPGELHAFLGQCDFVALTVPSTPDTHGLMGAREFAAMKRSAYLINVARGEIVDEPAMIAALRCGTIAGACLDVFATEPLPHESELWSMPNVIVTPHLAGMRDDYEEQLVAIFLDNFARLVRGEPMRNVVDLARGY